MASSKSSIRTTEIDKGWKKIVGQIGKCDKSFVQVGLQDDGTTEDPDPNAKPGAPPPPLVSMVAYWNEFGTDKIPSRPFMRQTFEKRNVELSKHIAAEYQAVLDGKKTAEFAMSLIGLWYEFQIKNEIVNGNWVPNAPAWAAIKESKRAPGNTQDVMPLIDTGRMRASVRYIVKMGGK